MSDYEKLKVTELKTLLKERGIAATGLTKKAQFIEALEEEDAKNGGAPAAGQEPDSMTVEFVQPQPAEEVQQIETDEPDTKAGEADVKDQPEEAPAAPKQEIEVDAEQAPSEKKRKRDPSPAEEEQTPKKAKADVDEAVTKQESTRESKSTSQSSLHVPTTALYIKNLMRPLQLSLFQDHLSSLAAADATSTQSNVVRTHLDSMKTHAFVLFDSIEAASRVRDQLHNSVWPAESQRKALWIDFIPEDKMEAWTEQENSASRDARFEVVYDDSNGTTSVSLTEIGGRPQQRQDRPAPSAPKDQRQREPDAEPDQQYDEPAKQAQQSGGSFSKLDQYFSFTSSRPKIYFKPVEEDLAKARIAELERETSRDWQGGKAWNRSMRLAPIDQLRRYTFEDGDKIVDGGVDFGGFGKKQFAGGTGPFIPGGPGRGGGRGGRGGGGYRGGY